MINFPLKRTRRLCVELRELSLDEAASVCRIPHDRPEAATTVFLKAAASRAAKPTDRYVTDPRLWTVEERALLVSHYMGTVSTSGYNIQLGALAHLSDYLLLDQDLSETEIIAGEAAGDTWVLTPLLGVHAELLEQVCTSRADWVVGTLACQMRRQDDPAAGVQDMGDMEAESWLRERMQQIRNLPESEVEAIYALYCSQRQRLRHFFIPTIGLLSSKPERYGIVFVPTEHAEAGVDYPVTFLAVSAVSETTRRVFALDHDIGR